MMIIIILSFFSPESTSKFLRTPIKSNLIREIRDFWIEKKPQNFLFLFLYFMQLVWWNKWHIDMKE